MSLAMEDEEVYQTGRGPRALKDKNLNKDTEVEECQRSL